MALSAPTLQQLEDTKTAVDEFYARRLAEVDRDVRNLREYGTPIAALGERTTEEAADIAVAFIETILST